LVFDDVEWGAQGRRAAEPINIDRAEAALEDVGVGFRKYYVGPYYIDHMDTRVNELPDIISSRLLCCPVDMTVVTKKNASAGRRRGTKTFHCTRMMFKEIPKVCAWASRFSDELLEEDRDEFPWTRNELELARHNNDLPSAGGASTLLREHRAL